MTVFCRTQKLYSGYIINGKPFQEKEVTKGKITPVKVY